MKFSRSEVLEISSTQGFDPLTIEKVLHLISLLRSLNSHPYLKGKLLLKGGTALNLFLLDLPRLSVDIDLNYVGELSGDATQRERPKIEQAAHAVFTREDFTVRRVPMDHAGGKWRLAYQSFSGRSGNLEVDMNFMFRQPLWNPTVADSFQLGRHAAKAIPIPDIHELVAGKLAALLARTQIRDLFDCQQIFRKQKIDVDRLRLGFVVYGGMNRKDWRTVSIDGITIDPTDVARRLIPTLRGSAIPKEVSPEDLGSTMVGECKSYLSNVLPLNDREIEFLNVLLEDGRVDGSILTSESELQNRINVHPLLQWKALNVRRHKKLEQ